MAEATLLGQNSGGSSLVSLMDLYDMDKWEWHHLNINNLSTPVSTTIVKVHNIPGYLIGVAFTNGGWTLEANKIFYQVFINNKKILDTICYGSNNGSSMSGIITTPFLIKPYSNSSSDCFLGIGSTNQRYDTPYIAAKATSTTQNQLLIAMAPIPFSSFQIDFSSTLDNFDSHYNFQCLYVTKKS